MKRKDVLSTHHLFCQQNNTPTECCRKPAVIFFLSQAPNSGSLYVQCRHPARMSRRAVGSAASVPRQGRAALAPGPMGTRTTLERKSDGRDRAAQLASDTSSTRSGALAPAVDVRPRPLDMPPVTLESTAGGQGGSFYVQRRHSARIAEGSRVKGSRPHRIRTTAIHKTRQWSRQTIPAQRSAITSSLEARAWKISKDRHVTRPPE